MTIFKTGALILSFAVALSLVLPQPAAALLGGLFKKNPAASSQPRKFPIHDEESFRKNTTSFHLTPFNNPKLEFDILLPKDWEAVSLGQDTAAMLSHKILNEAARFKSPIIDTAQAVVIVQSMNLPDEISAENWLKNHAFTNGYSLQEKITPLGNKKAATAFISIFEGKSTYTYATVHINGNVAVMARFEIPLALKNLLGFLQKRAIDSFRLIITTDDSVEVQKTYLMGEALKFSYPESWSFYQAETANPQRLSMQIHNTTPAKKIEGIIHFMAVRRSAKTDLLQELEGLKTYCDDRLAINIKKLLSSGPTAASGRFLFSRAETYQVAPKNNALAEQELRLVVLGDKNWYIFILLLTPTEASNLYTWANNTQVLELILKSLK